MPSRPALILILRVTRSTLTWHILASHSMHVMQWHWWCPSGERKVFVKPRVCKSRARRGLFRHNVCFNSGWFWTVNLYLGQYSVHHFFFLTRGTICVHHLFALLTQLHYTWFCMKQCKNNSRHRRDMEHNTMDRIEHTSIPLMRALDFPNEIRETGNLMVDDALITMGYDLCFI